MLDELALDFFFFFFFFFLKIDNIHFCFSKKIKVAGRKETNDFSVNNCNLRKLTLVYSLDSFIVNC